MRRRRPLAALLTLLILAGCQPKAAGADDAAFGARVRAYLLAHPEVLQEATQKLEAKLAADDAANRRTAEQKLPGLRAALERDPHDFVANPLGSVTVTEFYDYRCPHCISAAPQVVAMIHEHPDVRFVFKEMPIFGPVSQHAARAALAVKAAGGDYVGLYQAFMATPALDDQTIDRLAAAKGARARDMVPDASSEALAQIARNDALFEQLALGGTPAFIVGDQMILGDDMKSLSAAVAQARAGGTKATAG